MNIDKITGRRKIRITPDFLRHARKCCICRHPLREEIESDFLLWRNPRQIMKEYELAHHAAIYRHAHATGLATRRRENAYSVLDSIVEQVDDVQVTASTILRAMRAYSCLTPKGRWIDPPRRIIHEVRRPASAAPARAPRKEAPTRKAAVPPDELPMSQRLRPLRDRSAQRELPAAQEQPNDDCAKPVPQTIRRHIPAAPPDEPSVSQTSASSAGEECTP
jgi:hypothetical protein